MFRQAVRTLLHSPGFTALVVVVLAVGVGATAAIFTIVNGVLLEPLPFSDPARIVAIDPLIHGAIDDVSRPDFQDWRATARTLDHLAASASAAVTLTGSGEAAVLNAAVVDGDFFQLLGAAPLAGRVLTLDDEREGAPDAAVISAALWSSRFGSDPHIVGRSITLEDRPVTIVGVMPPAFEFPFDSDAVQIWLPAHTVPLTAQFAAQRSASFLHAIGHLAPGATRAQAQAELTSIAARLAAAYPKTNGIRTSVLVRPLQDRLVQRYRLALVVLLGAVGMVLLIACANVANLLLARGTMRNKEMAIRAALGASRARLIAQLLIESLLLSVAGGLAGLALADWGVSALVAASPVAIPRLHDVQVDRGVLVFAIATSILTGIVFGLAPAVHGSDADAGETLKDAGRGSSGQRSARTRQLLVVGEVALSLVLLVSAGLLARTVVALRHVDPGFVAEHAIGMQLTLSEKRYPTLAFYRRLLDEMRALPGVTSSAAATTLPLSGSDVGLGFTIEGQPVTQDPATRRSATYYAVSPGYFATMGIRQIRGRTFTARDDESAPPVIVISEGFARKYWPNEDPIGHRMTIGYNSSGPREIVGVVADVAQSDLAEPPPLEMYTPFPQTPWPFLAVIARTDGDPATLAGSLRAAVARIDPNQPAADIRTMDEYVARTVAAPRFTALLLAGFAGLAVLFAAFGLFSVMAYTVAQRRRELGIRMALGASPASLGSLVLSQAMRMGLAGIGVGLAGALAATRLLRSLLYGIGAGDPATFAAVAVLLLAVVAAAAYLPARLATRVDPMIALRTE